MCIFRNRAGAVAYKYMHAIPPDTSRIRGVGIQFSAPLFLYKGNHPPVESVFSVVSLRISRGGNRVMFLPLHVSFLTFGCLLAYHVVARCSSDLSRHQFKSISQPSNRDWLDR